MCHPAGVHQQHQHPTIQALRFVASPSGCLRAPASQPAEAAIAVHGHRCVRRAGVAASATGLLGGGERRCTQVLKLQAGQQHPRSSANFSHMCVLPRAPLCVLPPLQQGCAQEHCARADRVPHQHPQVPAQHCDRGCQEQEGTGEWAGAPGGGKRGRGAGTSTAAVAATAAAPATAAAAAAVLIIKSEP